MIDKKHWYDGMFYDKFIAPNQDKLFSEIKKIISSESRVLDIGCGTGRLAFQLSEHCKKVVGIDLSSKNIFTAKDNQKDKFPNIEFIHGDANKVKEKFNDKFDYAVITYVIHEMPENERIKILEELKNIANKIIIGDYLTPTPKTFWGRLNIIVEFLAGSDHYNNFKNYVKNGGINYLAKESKLKKIKEVMNQPQTAHLVVLE